jgi:hypothetical protein
MVGKNEKSHEYDDPRKAYHGKRRNATTLTDFKKNLQEGEYSTNR